MIGRLPLMCASLLAGLALAGCGAGDVIDSQKAEIALRFDVQQATDTKIREVTCPTDVPAQAGNRFTCHVVAASGDEAVAELEVTTQSGDLRVLGIEAP